MVSPGQHLRTLREQLGLTMRDVEIASAALAAKHGNDDFSVPLSRLSDIETKGIVPSIFRLYSLAVIYRCDLRDLLSWYGIDLNEVASDLNVASPPKSHRADTLQSATNVRIPVRLDPGFDARKPPIWAAWWSSGGWCHWLTWQSSRTPALPTDISVRKISRCTPCCRPAPSSRSTRPRTRSCRAPGTRSTSGPFISWKRPPAIPAAGARFEEITSYCSPIPCRHCKYACCGTPRMPKSSAR